ncbi:C2 family cysteine protease [Nostoc parmelioides]|uniref:Pre-peptidase C-terminal domain-containing protein n=1 Tax=Nostoc parmelioides FACHB-3921 TaxID=2692909 RepID=A0ABR8BF24_9NOSO|nr:C2 family cysteine protease [Nostoc parmelioides]MBD2252421.1 pre-peptidase C-terminal domain-containing protein [Nostoc parmelioides FACHB-3921]
MIFDNAGNTLGSARRVNLTTTTQTFTDFIGSSDVNDFYSFSLNIRSSLNLTLSGLTTNADIQIIRDTNSNGIIDGTSEIIGSSNLLEIANDSIRTTLDTGNYFIRIFPGIGSTFNGTNYNLSLSINTAPNSLAFTIDNPTINNTGSLNISRGQVFDANGASDISVIDFQIFQNGLLVNSISNDVTRITTNANDNRWGSFTHNLSLVGLNLAGGNYTLRATALDTFRNSSQVVERIFTVQADWFSQNLKDQQMLTLVKNLAQDGNLSRNDMITIFRDTKDNSVVDVNELSDLRVIINNSPRFTIQDHVRILSNKVANSDMANINSGIGNLFAGSSADQLEKLLGKWFFGSDRPQLTSTQFTYREARGTLFQNGISYQDVDQGAIGNCYFLAGLANTALRTPNVIQSMFIDNGDNTFTVRFYNNKVADFVTVDKFLATLNNLNSNYVSGGNIPYAKIGGRHDNPNTELWVALAEKAYAQINESGWTRGPASGQRRNSYQAIVSGYAGRALTDITGSSTQYDNLDSLDMNAIVTAFNQGQMICFASRSSTQVATNVVSSHAYVLVGYSSFTQRFRLYNPWGVNGGYENGIFKDGFLDLSFNDLLRNFLGWDKTS